MLMNALPSRMYSISYTTAHSVRFTQLYTYYLASLAEAAHCHSKGKMREKGLHIVYNQRLIQKNVFGTNTLYCKNPDIFRWWRSVLGSTLFVL